MDFECYKVTRDYSLEKWSLKDNTSLTLHKVTEFDNCFYKTYYRVNYVGLKVKEVDIYSGKEFAYNLFKELEIKQNVLFDSDKA